MKNLKGAILLFVITLFSAQVCRAAFPTKSNYTEVSTALTTASNTSHHRFTDAVRSVWTHSKAKIEQIVYIILAILPLGWLGMGLNDNFQGYDWLISLVLYLVLWLPGIIYTLIMMPKYY